MTAVCTEPHPRERPVVVSRPPPLMQAVAAVGRRPTDQGNGRPDASGRPVRSRSQRIGMPYCRPPFVHSAFWPRLIFSRRALADVLLEALAVVADVLDDAVGPVVGQADGFAELAFGAEQALDLRVVGGLHLVDIGLGDAELLGVQHGHVGPADDVAPLVVALADRRAERLLGDDLRQHDVVVRGRGASGARHRGRTRPS